MRDIVLLSGVFLYGISMGSFLNVVIYRLPIGKSLLNPPSHCPACGTRIRFYDNIPLLSFAILGGKCRSCKSSISIRYPLVELLAGLLTVYAFYHFGVSFKAFEAAFLSFLFIAVFFIDLDHQIIPDVFTLPGILLGFAASLTSSAFIGWTQSLAGIVVGGGLFFLLGLLGKLVFRKEALGLGDVKFAAMMGAFLGWQNLLFVLVLASFLGSVVGLTMILIAGGKRESSYIPFGPFLAISAWVAIYFGNSIIKAYLDFIGA